MPAEAAARFCGVRQICTTAQSLRKFPRDLTANTESSIDKGKENGMTLTQIRKCPLWFFVAISLAATAACAPTVERRGTGEVIDDAALTARVKTALAKAEGLKGAAAINVNSYRGEVQLSGFVESQDLIQRAGATARGVEGVQSVRNDLHVGSRQ
jgi:hyperosmotically inducible periplasmic protein